MTITRVSFIDVYVLRKRGEQVEALVLRRGGAGRCPGSWETVHGSIEADEKPVAAALRELMEETGLDPVRFYNLSRVETFYRHLVDEVALIPVFVAWVAPEASVRLGSEHDQFEWLNLADARARFAWPRERRALDDIEILVGRGDAGPLEDVLRVK